MPVMKGLLAPQNTFLDTIATRFDGTRRAAPRDGDGGGGGGRGQRQQLGKRRGAPGAPEPPGAHRDATLRALHPPDGLGPPAPCSPRGDREGPVPRCRCFWRVPVPLSTRDRGAAGGTVRTGRGPGRTGVPGGRDPTRAPPARSAPGLEQPGEGSEGLGAALSSPRSWVPVPGDGSVAQRVPHSGTRRFSHQHGLWGPQGCPSHLRAGHQFLAAGAQVLSRALPAPREQSVLFAWSYNPGKGGHW